MSSSNPVTIGGANWESDIPYRSSGYSFKLSNTSDQSSEIRLTDQDQIYRSYVSSQADNNPIAYKIPLNDAGKYFVRLHLAENYWRDANQRVFHILVEGNIVEMAIDLVGEAGYKTAVVKDYEVTITDGALDLEILPVINRPVLSAVEIYHVSSQESLSLNVIDVNDADCSGTNGGIQVELNSQKGSLYKLGKYGVYQGVAFL